MPSEVVRALKSYEAAAVDSSLSNTDVYLTPKYNIRQMSILTVFIHLY
jgi:S-adenosylmethionine:tRNA-ribosyltransferase-isomerase (queuine synthetase)